MAYSIEVTVLSSLLSGITMLGLGKCWGASNKVSITACNERRGSCKEIKDLSFQRIEERLTEHDKLLKGINGKIDTMMLRSKIEHSN